MGSIRRNLITEFNIPSSMEDMLFPDYGFDLDGIVRDIEEAEARSVGLQLPEGLKRQGAAKVAAACVHALFMLGAEEKIKAAGADLIVATDTVESRHGKVTVAGLIADHVKTL